MVHNCSYPQVDEHPTPHVRLNSTTNVRDEHYPGSESVVLGRRTVRRGEVREWTGLYLAKVSLEERCCSSLGQVRLVKVGGTESAESGGTVTLTGSQSARALSVLHYTLHSLQYINTYYTTNCRLACITYVMKVWSNEAAVDTRSGRGKQNSRSK